MTEPMRCQPRARGGRGEHTSPHLVAGSSAPRMPSPRGLRQPRARGGRGITGELLADTIRSAPRIRE